MCLFVIVLSMFSLRQSSFANISAWNTELWRRWRGRIFVMTFSAAVGVVLMAPVILTQASLCIDLLVFCVFSQKPLKKCLQMQTFLPENNLLLKWQSGIRSQHSCKSTILRGFL